MAADVYDEFFASIGEKLRNPELDYKQALGYVDRIEKSMVFFWFFWQKLEKYGFRGRILCLLKNYFTNRFQFVQTDIKISSSRSM